MHTGSAVERDGDWFGAAVNVAARVAAAAGGDEVLLTEQTRKAAGELSEIGIEKRGPQRFRNVSEPVVLFRAYAAEGRGPVEVDPVCKMTVDPAHAAGSLTHEGTVHHFCSLECAAAFAADPEAHLG
jgi:YHS domain-containing protein